MKIVRVWLITLAVVASTLGAIGTPTPAVADVFEDSSNHALSGSASQSSTVGGFVASNAIDGNVTAWDGPGSDDLGTRTSFNSNAWWQIDLGSVKNVPEIKVWRTEFEPILENFSVFISDNAFTSTNFTTTQNQAGVTEYSFGTSPNCSQGTSDWWCEADPFERISHSGTGRYVRVQLHGTGQLSLAEVEIGGPFNEIAPEPVASWGVRGLGPSLSTKEDQEVWAIEQIGGTIYVGGRFLEVVNQRFAGGAQEVEDQPYIAAFNATTGEFIDFWRPDLDGAVFALEASADGSKLFVGGEFTNVDGIPHTAGLVALDPRTGHVEAGWRASLEKRLVIGPATVRNLEIEGSWLYVVGNFTNAITFPNLSAVSVKNAIRVSVSNGALDNGWKPQVTGGAAWGVDVDTSRNRVYLAGKFTAVNGTADSAWFHTVNTTNAASVGGLDAFTFIHSQRDQRDVVVAGDRVWVGGAQHYLQMLDASDLSLMNGYFTGNGPPPNGLSGGGDTQDIELVGDRIYTTCHCWLNDGSGSKLWEYSPNGGGFTSTPLDFAYGNMAFDAQSGDYISQFGSEPDDYSGVLGGWAIHGAPDGCLWFGGDFISSGEQWPIGLMRQCPEDGAGSNPAPITQAPADNTKPSTPTGVTAVERANQQVEINWNASSDNDAVAGYLIYRDGQQIAGTAGTKLRYDETPGSTHSWTVRAIDPSGNLSNVSSSTGNFAVAIPAGYPTHFVDERFATETGGFNYSDDTFRGTSEPAYADGVYDTTAGKTNGGLGVRLGGVDDDDIFGMSGGWAKTFNLASPTEVEVSFKARLQVAAAYESSEEVEVLVSVDGSLFSIVDLDGGCSSCTISWTTYTIDLGTLSAGNHTITVGGYNNQKTTETEAGSIAIDDVEVATSFPGVGLTSPVPGGQASGVFTIGIGADDLMDADGTLDVDVRINGGSWLQASWNAGLGVYTRSWDTTGLPEGAATIQMRAKDSDNNTTTSAVQNVIINNVNQAPSATITTPSNGADVSGTVTVRVNASDAEDAAGTLDVDVNTGQGWKNATWNAGNQRYEYTWDTTQQSDGAKTVQARATDAQDSQTSASSIGVTIENVDVAPTATIATPGEGLTVTGVKTVRVNASDSEDGAGTLDVEVNVGDGNGWQSTVWNPGNERYEFSWDTALMADGPAVVKARATDSGNNTTNATDRNVVIDNVDLAPTATISAPTEGATLSGTFVVKVNATDVEDAVGTLDVEVNTGQGWQTASWNAGTQRYEYSWDTTQQSDGAKNVRARATDSGGTRTDATDRSVTVDNIDAAPSATITTPIEGVTWSGNKTVRVNASDAEDAAGTLDVEVNLSDGNGWQPTVWNPANQRYEFALDTTTLPNGAALVKARATDSANTTTNATDRSFVIDNADLAPTAIISAPGNGDTISGTVIVKVNATDAEDAVGTLDVDVNVGNGWKNATWNAATQRYEYSWDTTADPDGSATVQARATDSSDNTTTAGSRSVTLDNTTNTLPTISFKTPTPNTVITGDYLIKVKAQDAEDSDATLDVEVNYGAGWVQMTWNAVSTHYHLKLDSQTRPDGPFNLRARVTDSANDTTQTPAVPMNISNSEYSDLVFSNIPIMYWRFNETSGAFAGDSRKANDNAAYKGVNPNSGSLLSDGEPGTAARFDGNNDWVKIPNRTALNTGGPYATRSIELWFRADNTNGRQVLYEEGGSSKGFNIYLDGDTLYAGAWNQSNEDETTPWPASFLSYDGIEAGETYFVAITFTTKTDRFRLFVNGQLEDKDGGIGHVFSHASQSAIGGVMQDTRFHDGAANGDGFFFDGKIDEVAVFNQAMSAPNLLGRWEVGSGNN